MRIIIPRRIMVLSSSVFVAVVVMTALLLGNLNVVYGQRQCKYLGNRYNDGYILRGQTDTCTCDDGGWINCRRNDSISDSSDTYVEEISDSYDVEYIDL